MYHPTESALDSLQGGQELLPSTPNNHGFLFEHTSASFRAHQNDTSVWPYMYMYMLITIQCANTQFCHYTHDFGAICTPFAEVWISHCHYRNECRRLFQKLALLKSSIATTLTPSPGEDGWHFLHCNSPRISSIRIRNNNVVQCSEPLFSLRRKSNEVRSPQNENCNYKQVTQSMWQEHCSGLLSIDGQKVNLQPATLLFGYLGAWQATAATVSL